MQQTVYPSYLSCVGTLDIVQALCLFYETLTVSTKPETPYTEPFRRPEGRISRMHTYSLQNSVKDNSNPRTPNSLPSPRPLIPIPDTSKAQNDLCNEMPEPHVREFF